MADRNRPLIFEGSRGDHHGHRRGDEFGLVPQDSSCFAYASGFERVRLWLKAQLFRKADSLNFPRWTLGKFIKEEHFLRYLEWC